MTRFAGRLLASVVLIGVAVELVRIVRARSSVDPPPSSASLGREPADGSAIETEPTLPTALRAPVSRDPESDPEVHHSSEAAAAPRAAPGSILGRVVDSNGRPVAAADVELRVARHDEVGSEPSRVSTGLVASTSERGEYRFASVAPGDEYRVAARRFGVGAGATGPIVVTSALEARVSDVLLTDGVRLSGVVRAGGRPVESAVVTWFDLHDLAQGLEDRNDPAPADASTRRAVTDAEGRYEFDLLPVTLSELVAQAPGRARVTFSASTAIDVPRDQRIDFELGEARLLAGRVVDASGDGIAGARVVATLTRDEWRCDGEASADESGRFVVESLADGSYVVRAERHGFHSSERESVESGRRDVELVLTRLGGVTGVVIDERSGETIAQYEVSVLRSSPGSEAGFHPVAGHVRLRFHQREGRCEIDGLEPGDYVLEAWVSGYATCRSETFRVEREAPRPVVRVRMNRGGSVVGTVVDRSGRAIEGATVRLQKGPAADASDPTTATAAGGDFRFDGVAAGSYRLAVRQARFELREIVGVAVEPDRATSAGTIELADGARIVGHVWDEAGEPLAGAVVIATEKGGSLQRTVSNQEGLFELESLAVGEYTVMVEARAAQPRSARTVVLAAGDERTVDFRLSSSESRR